MKCQTVGLQICLEWTTSEVFFKNFAKIIKQFFFITENVVTAVFSYIYQWLLSNKQFCHVDPTINYIPKVSNRSTVRISHLQFAKRFGSLQMNFCIFSKNFASLKSDTSWVFRVIHLTSYIVSCFKPIKYPLLNNNMISQKFRIHIISSYILPSFLLNILLWSGKL